MTPKRSSFFGDDLSWIRQRFQELKHFFIVGNGFTFSNRSWIEANQGKWRLVLDAQELQEHAEHAHHSGQKAVGLTTAIVAVLLAIATLLSHRAHTEEVVLKGDANDLWAYYQAKNVRAHMYEADAKLAALSPEGKELANQFMEEAKVEREGAPAKNGKPAKEGADAIQDKAKDRDAETALAGRRSNFYDGAELFLEISIVLCSIALLAENKMYWRLSFITTVAGVVTAIWGLLLK